MRTLRLISMILVTCAVSVSAVACDIGTPSAPPAPSAPAAPTAPAGPTGSTATGAASEQAAEEAVANNWQAFFNAKTPPSRRIALLQDGQQFAAIIQAESGTSIESEVSAQVTKVTITTPNRFARVSYTILLGGQPALSGQQGTAVFTNGVWQVGDNSLCNLLILENGGSKSSLPSVCQSVAAG